MERFVRIREGEGKPVSRVKTPILPEAERSFSLIYFRKKN